MTEDQFIAGMQRLQQIDPENALLPFIARGYSRVNGAYLIQALSSLKDPVPGKEASKPKEEMSSDLISLYRVKSTLFGERAKLSNRFHLCDSDQARLAVSLEIEGIQNQIQDVFRQIRMVEKGGQLDSQQDHSSIPSDPIELVKRLNSLRSMISRKKRAIEALMGKNGPKVKIQLSKAEETLRQLELTKAHVERAIAATTIQSE